MDKKLSTLSRSQARRLALGAQGFTRPRPSSVGTRRHAQSVFGVTQLIQIDSVNVLARAHEMPLWSRLGTYRRGVLHEMLERGELFEYWAHEASLLPAQDWPLMRWQMDPDRRAAGWSSVHAMRQRNPDLIDRLFKTIRDQGATAASEFNQPGRRTGPWWDWSDAKLALEFLFVTGQVTARRKSNFERVYDLPERCLPPAFVSAPAIPEAEARRIMLERSARALGVATERDLCDYYRLKPKDSHDALRRLTDEGAIVPVAVEGWTDTAFMHRDAVIPRAIRATSVLSPFDPVVWNRPRNERLFDFHYRIEIYTPKEQRTFGYYVLPFLLGDQIAGRVDLKADRKASCLLVPGAFSEGVCGNDETADGLARELRDLACWLELDDITVGKLGNLSSPLRSALRDS